MLLKALKLLSITLILNLFSGVVFAASGITYHGRILRSNGDPVNGQFVGFRLRLMDGDTGACKMYEEIQTKDMRTSAGVFSIVIGDGSVVGTYGATGITFFDGLFQNSKTYNFAVGNSCEFSPYTALARHGRKLNVSFRESPTDPWEDMPVMNIEHVPFAFSALTSQKVGNHGDGSLLRVENSGTPQNIPALTPTQYSELFDLVSGNSTQYIQSVLGTAGQISVNTSSGVATVGLPDVATAGVYGSATQVPVFTLDAKGRITAVTNTTITGAAPTGVAGGDLTGNFPNPDIAAGVVGTTELGALAVTDAKLAADAVTTTKILDANVTLDKLATDSVNSAKIVDGSIVGADISSTAALSVASVTATGAVTSDSVSTRSIGLFELPVNGTNYIAMKAPDLLAGNTTYTWPAAAPGSNMVLQSDASGNLSWVADATGAANAFVQSGNAFGATAVLGTTDNNNLSIITNNTAKMTVLTSGNVGIGTTTPETQLSLANTGVLQFGSTADANYAQFSRSNLSFSRTDSNFSYINQKGVGAGLLFRTSNAASSDTNAMAILADGKVGIGTIAPVAKLEINEATDGTASLRLTGNRTASGGHSARIEMLAPQSLSPADTKHFEIANINGAFSGAANALQFRQKTDAGTARGIMALSNGGSGVSGGVMIGSYAHGLTVNNAPPSDGLIVSGKVGFGTDAPTAALQIKAGTAAAGTAPLKLTAGVNLGTPEAGAIEFDGTNLYYTDSSNTRRTLGTSGGLTALTGDVTATGPGSAAATIANDAVTFAKFQNITDNKLLGRSAGSSGDMQEIIVGTGLSMSGGTLTATATAPSDASYAAKGIVQFDTDAATSGINISGGIAKLATSGVVANTYGAADKIPVITVDAFGRITSASDTNIAIAASQVTSGVLDVARGGTGTGTLTANRMFMANGTGTALLADTCTIGQVLEYNGTVWACKASSTLGAANAFVQSGNAFAATAVLGTTDNNNLQFITNNTAKMTILADGKVGIGTATPAKKLVVQDEAALEVRLINNNAGVNQTTDTEIAKIDFNPRFNSGNGSEVSRISSFYRGDGTTRSGDLRFSTANSSSAAERMRITEAGNVGIGTTAPTRKLDVYANSGSTTVVGFRTNDYILGAAGSTLTFDFGASSGNTYSEIRAFSNGGNNWDNLILQRGGGNVGIGTAAPSAKLEVAGTIKATAFDGPMTSSSTGTPGAYTINTDTDNNGSDGGVNIQTNGSNVAQFTATGIMLAGTGGASTPALSFMADPNTGVRNPSADALSLMTGGTDRLTVDSSGNVGIGTTSPASKLHVNDGFITNDRYGSGAAMILRSAAGTSGSATAIATSSLLGQLSFRGYDGTNYQTSAYVAGSSDGAISNTSAPGFLSFYTTPSGSVSAQHRMRITSDGNVGIGTSTPSSLLHVEGSSNNGGVPATSAAAIELRNVSSDALPGRSSDIIFAGTAAPVVERRYAAITGLVTGSDSSVGNSGSLLFSTKATNTGSPLERMRINNDGNVGIGTTTPNILGGNANSRVLSIAGDGTLTTASGRLELSSPRANGSLAAADEAGRIAWSMDNNTGGTGNHKQIGVISSSLDGVGGANGFGGRINFNTKNDNAASAPIRMTITSSGNVGIATTSPGKRLEVVSTQSGVSDDGIKINNSASGWGTSLTFGVGNDGGYESAQITSTNDNTTDSTGGLLHFKTAQQTSNVLTTRMTISDTGNVGIGATSPTAKLHIHGNGATANGLMQISSTSAAADGALAKMGPYSYINANASGATLLNWGARFDGDTDQWVRTYTAATSYLPYVKVGTLNTIALGGSVSNSTSDTNPTMQDRVVLDLTTGNVGIGTTNPTQKLDVAGTIKATAFDGPMTSSSTGTSGAYTINTDTDNNGSDGGVNIQTNGSNVAQFTATGIMRAGTGGASTPALSFMADSDTGVRNPAADSLALTTGGTDRLTVDSVGRVGIGTSAPASLLHVSGDTQASFILEDRDEALNEKRWALKTAVDMQGHLQIQSLNDDNSVRTKVMAFSPTGNVGIGVTAPSEKLDIDGGVMMTGGDARLRLQRTGGAAFPNYIDFNNDATSRLHFRSISNTDTGSNIRMTIKADDGYVGIGTVSPIGQLQVIKSGETSVTNSAMDVSSKQYFFGDISDASKINGILNVQGSQRGVLNLWSNDTALNTSLSAIKFPHAARSTTNENNANIAYMAVGSTSGTSTTGGNLRFGTRADNGLLEQRMMITDTGNVGIGTPWNAPPTKKLVVQEDNGQTGIALYNANTTNGNRNVFSLRTDTTGAGASTFFEVAGVASNTTEHNHATRNTNLEFSTDSAATGVTTKMTIMGAGNVGIGTASPSAPLQVTGDSTSNTMGIRIGSNAAIGLTYSDVTPVIGRNVKADTTNNVAGQMQIMNTTTSGAAAIKLGSNLSGTANDGIQFHISGNSYSANDVFSSEVMRINYDGNVGVGTNTPDNRLHIAETSANQFRLQNGNQSLWIRQGYKSDGTVTPAVDALNVNFQSSGSSSGSLSFTNGNTEVMRIVNNNVGIGTINPTSPLHVSTTATSGNIANFVSTGAGGAGCSIAWNGTSCSSDARLKENVVSVDAVKMLDDLLKLRPVHFTWIRDQKHEKQTGFIAQELEKYFPEFVKTDDKGYKQVNYAHFVSVLTSSVQSLYQRIVGIEAEQKVQNREIASLKQENSQLKKDNEEMKKRLDRLEKIIQKSK